MESASKSSLKFLPLGLLAALAIVLAAYFLGSPSAPLPVLGQIRPFQLTNQSSEPVTLATLRDRTWVANIIFTRCPGPCLRMTQTMEKLQAALASEPDVALVTLTTDPDYDTPEVLQAYAKKFGGTPGRWLFLTGTKAEIFKLAVEDLKLTAVETDPDARTSPEDLFVHSTVSVVVDSRGRLRGVAEALEPGGLEQLQAWVRQLTSR